MGEYAALEGDLDATGMRFAIVAARFNHEVTEQLCAGAEKKLREHGADDVTVAWVPGAFELPLVAKRFAASGTVDAVICLGAVIRGEPGQCDDRGAAVRRGQRAHSEYGPGECAAGVTRASLDTGVPVAFGVLTVEDRAQAL